MINRGFILFDIDGVIRDVTNSYRLAIKKTVESYCNWNPSIKDIDKLKSEGLWNNDWDASLELIKRYQTNNKLPMDLPNRGQLIDRFNSFYFGGDPEGDFKKWNGFILKESLLVNKNFFEKISRLNIKWGFVSGAEPSSANYILQERIGLIKPPIIAMGDAPEKPNPNGFIKLIEILSNSPINKIKEPIGYVGDTVADVLTVINARKKFPKQKFFSFAVSPPHLHKKEQNKFRRVYEEKLVESGADFILESTNQLLNVIKNW